MGATPPNPSASLARNQGPGAVRPGPRCARPYPSVSCEILYCSSFLYKLLRGVSISSAVLEMFHPCSRSFAHQERPLADLLELPQRPGGLTGAAEHSAAGRSPPRSTASASGHVDGRGPGRITRRRSTEFRELADVARASAACFKDRYSSAASVNSLRTEVVLTREEPAAKCSHQLGDVVPSLPQGRHAGWGSR